VLGLEPETGDRELVAIQARRGAWYVGYPDHVDAFLFASLHERLLRPSTILAPPPCLVALLRLTEMAALEMDDTKPVRRLRSGHHGGVP